MIKLSEEVLTDIKAASSREWLETNGIGGYSSGTVAGLNSRRYHGYLVAAAKPPLGRAVLLSKLEETLIVNGERLNLSCNRFPGVVEPRGYEYLTSFRLDPFPIWTYRVAGIEIEKTLFMVHGENTVVCSWSIGDKPAAMEWPELEIRPLLAFRDHHHLRHGDTDFKTSYTTENDWLRFRPVPELPPLLLSSNAVSIEPTGHWYRDFEYSIEMERGFDHHEDLFQPCALRFNLSKPATIIASTEERDYHDAEAFRKREMKRRALVVAKAGARDDFSTHLALAADQFIVSRGKGNTVIAGGDFLRSGAEVLNRIGRWSDGQWRSMGGGFNAAVQNGQPNLGGDQLIFMEPESEHSSASFCEGFAVAGGRVDEELAFGRARHQAASSASLVNRRNFSGATRIAAPVGQARTHAGPPSMPEHMSHLIAFLGASSPPFFPFFAHFSSASPGPGPEPKNSHLSSPGFFGGILAMRMTP